VSYYSAIMRRGGQPVEFYRFQYVGTTTALAKWNASDTAREFSIPGTVHPTGGDILETYLPAPVRREAIEGTEERSGTGLKIIVPEDDAETNGIVDLYRDGGPVSPVELCVYRSWRGSATAVREFYGNITGATFEKGECTLNCDPKSGALQHPILRQLYQGPCNNEFGDAFCGVDLDALAVSGTVDAISADGITVTVSEADDSPDGYFAKGGRLTFGSRYGFITAHVGGVLTLFRAVPGLIVGSSVTLTPGCDHSLTDCTVFNNVANHMGFPFIPSVDPFTQGVD
jgi:uncharacterized phage protein (TIGR02218 family)